MSCIGIGVWTSLCTFRCTCMCIIYLGGRSKQVYLLLVWMSLIAENSRPENWWNLRVLVHADAILCSGAVLTCTTHLYEHLHLHVHLHVHLPYVADLPKPGFLIWRFINPWSTEFFQSHRLIPPCSSMYSVYSGFIKRSLSHVLNGDS